MSLAETALLASLLAGLATGLGAIPILFIQEMPRRTYGILLGFSGGVMLSATAFNLVEPALDTSGLAVTAFGIALGALLLLALDQTIPHLEPHFNLEPPNLAMRQGIMLALAVTLHNFPEGLAVGVGYTAGDEQLGFVLAMAIGLQNIPEGLAVAGPLRMAGVSPWRCLALATASGLAEPVAAAIGIVFQEYVGALLGIGLAFAGGAMLYVISDQLIPESHRKGFEREGTLGTIVGFIVMISLWKGLS